VKKIFLIAVLLFPAILFGQKRTFNWYWSDGRIVNPDSIGNGSINGVEAFTKTNFLADDILGKNSDMVLYIPLIHSPVLVCTKDTLTLKNALKSFKNEKYLSSSSFNADFDDLKDKIHANTKYITYLLGKPDTIQNNDKLSNGVTYYYNKYHFNLDFENDILTSYKVFDLPSLKLKGFAISDFHIALDESSTYVTGFSIDYYNFFHKKIKYIYTTVSALNAVNDVIQTKTSKSNGPIEPNEKATYNFDNLFFSKIISTIEVSYIKIQYFDGSIKLFTKKDIYKLFID
jgi:hypothetical protein